MGGAASAFLIFCVLILIGAPVVLSLPGSAREWTGLAFEAWLQLRGEAPEERRIRTADRGYALTHNLGGYPGEMVSFVSILGTELG